MSETEYTGNRALFRLNSGGNNQTFMVINGFDSHATSFSNNLPEGTNFANAYNEKFGENAWQEDWSAASEAIEMWGSSVVKMMYRPDLSSQL